MRQAEESARKAAALNAAEEARKVQNWVMGRQIKQSQTPMLPVDDSLEDEEKAFQAYKPVRKPQTPRPVVPGYASYRAGERAGCAAGQAQRRPWWQRAGGWLADRLNDGAQTLAGLRDALAVRHLNFNKLKDGKISVSAKTPPGARLDYKQLAQEKGFGFKGTRYNPGTVANITGKGLLKSALSKSSAILAGAASLASNLWTFGTNPTEGETFMDRTVKNREFWVSTGVDVGVSLVVGLAAAAVVAGVITLFAITAPLSVTVAVTAGVSIGLGLLVESTGFSDTAKSWLNAKFYTP